MNALSQYSPSFVRNQKSLFSFKRMQTNPATYEQLALFLGGCWGQTPGAEQRGAEGMDAGAACGQPCSQSWSKNVSNQGVADFTLRHTKAETKESSYCVTGGGAWPETSSGKMWEFLQGKQAPLGGGREECCFSKNGDIYKNSSWAEHPASQYLTACYFRCLSSELYPPAMAAEPSPDEWFADLGHGCDNAAVWAER